ncbi:GspH/FimT family pseudopilin [Halomonas stenophila]|uniref:Type II secretion system protein H n=1 Tax=Halomonas stenophila TaxID=795312 RepID=A0A7W5EUU6_9GAMM|nr:GspH/FimT family pseudopilin [Halomonas stenophila]MBB3231874.1 type IV fimbrial biogenesis protein FimT [Halomonas stenophila]
MNAGDKKRHSGFTLIELLVAIAMVAILATMAVPSFQGMMIRNQLTTDFNQVLTGIHYARSEAIKSRKPVTVVMTSGADGDGWKLEVWEGDGSTAVSCPTDAGCWKVMNENDSAVNVSVTTGSGSGKVTFNQLGRASSSCPLGTPCSISLEHENLTGSPETLNINALGNITRP